MSDFREQRIEKVEMLKQKGIDPFGKKFNKEFSLAYLHDNYEENKQVSSAGRIMNIRAHGKSIFMDLRDDTCKIQIYFKNDDLVSTLDIGDIIGVHGKLTKTRTGEITIFVEEFTYLAKALRPLPEKWHGLKDVEIRYRQRYLDLLVNDEVKNRFLQRSRIIREIRSFLDGKNFIEVETPMMQSIAGGAAARPFITHHNTLDMDLYLRIAPELFLKRLLVGGFEKIYEINRNFRNEGISPRHNPEFTMLEIYSAYDDYEDMMKLTEDLVSYLIQNVIKADKIKLGENEIDFSTPWKRISMYDAVREYAGIDIKNCNLKTLDKKYDLPKSVSPEEVLNIIFEEEVEAKLINPTFITDYPAILCPLSKTKKDNPSIAERFEFFIGGQEIANAYSELNNPIEQKERFMHQADSREEGHSYSMDEDFVKALEYGMPPAGGLGIGIDRLVMMLTGVENVREVILFPQLRSVE